MKPALLPLLACAALSGAVPARPSAAPPGRERLEQSAGHLLAMKTSLDGVLTRLAEARDEKDAARVACLEERLGRMKALLRVAEAADVALREELATRGTGAEEELSRIAVARKKAEAARAEADRCVGQLAYIVEEKTTVEVIEPDDLPELTRAEERSLPRASRTARRRSHAPPAAAPVAP